MSRPWMPLYVGDYLADTGHLTTVEHGAYFLLIMHYWRRGGLPTDDAQLARITKMTEKQWQASRGTLADLFADGWKHKRIDHELSEAERVSAAGRAGGLASGEARRKRTTVERPLNDGATKCEAPQSQPQSHLQHKETKTFNSVGEKKVNGWSPPRHGATSTRVGRVYVVRGTPEWQQYAEDWKAAHGEEPTPNEHGGKWFRTLGEQ